MRNIAPQQMVAFAPQRSEFLTVTSAYMIIVKLTGNWDSAASRMVSPYPAPISGDACSSCVVMSVLPKNANPTSSADRCGISTERRAETRRSTRGFRLRRCWNAHHANNTAEAANIVSTAGLDQPHELPCVIGTSRLISAAVSPTAPTPSKRPPDRTRDSRMNTAAATLTSTPIAVVTQNSMCQLAYSVIDAANGSPAAVPMPRVELIIAIALLIRSFGSSSRRIEIPMGTTAAPAPWQPRARISRAMFEVNAHSSEPTVIIVNAVSNIRFLPYMSARRPKIGVITAPTRSVVVISQDTAVWLAPVSAGMLGRSGTMTVCSTAWKIAPTARMGNRNRDADCPARSPIATGVARRPDGRTSEIVIGTPYAESGK